MFEFTSINRVCIFYFNLWMKHTFIKVGEITLFSVCLCVCVYNMTWMARALLGNPTYDSMYVYVPYLLLNTRTNLYETWHIYRVTWGHLENVLHKSSPSPSVYVVCMCILFSLLSNGLVKKLRPQRIHTTIEEILDASFCMLSLYQRKVGD
jgi:hypothetical protein